MSRPERFFLHSFCPNRKKYDKILNTEIKTVSCTVYYTEQTKGREDPWIWKAMPKK